MFKRIPGTKDILPEQVVLWQRIEQIARNIFSLYNYQEIRTPILEDAQLFSRSLGEGTEIVQKQMFLIRNQQDTYALRPEGTATIVRAYLENNLDKKEGLVKFYYLGPMFRFERPQKGRLRQFHHLGCEVIGRACDNPAIDIELISLADTLLKAYQIRDYKIILNSLGCLNDRLKLIKLLKAGLQDNLEQLCVDCQARFSRNILRLLDCKNAYCQRLIRDLNIENYLCGDCQGHFNRIKEGMRDLGINYAVLPYLVRGLDYYYRTVFEIRHADLGAQDALGAGGRYDPLIAQLGGSVKFGAMGFAFGLERLLLVSALKAEVSSQNLVYLITLGDAARQKAVALLHKLRKADVACDTDYENKSLKGAMRKANDLGARFVLLLGDEELKKNTLSLKDMTCGEQREIKEENLIQELKSVA